MDLAGRLAAGIREAVLEAAGMGAAGMGAAGLGAAGGQGGDAIAHEVAAFLEGWPEGGGVRRAQRPEGLPVCRWLAGISGGLAGLVAREAAALEWRQTYGTGDFGAEFLARYGWTEVVGLRGPIPSERVAAGFLLLGPDVTYPPHAHEAAEIYLPLSGAAWWQKGGGAFRQVAVGAPVYHAPWVPHAMRTEAEPLLALYLWRGGDLAAKSVILG